MIRRIVAGIVVATIAAFGWAAVSTADNQHGRTDSRSSQTHPKPPVPGHGLDVLELRKINQVLENQERILERLNNLDGSTIPAQFGVLYNAFHTDILSNVGNLLAAVSDVGSQCASTDVLPLPSQGTVAPYGFCRGDDSGNLIVRVHNQGFIAAGPFTTRVTFAGGSLPVDVDVTGLNGFTGTDLNFGPIPDSCYPGLRSEASQCNFTIAADFNATVNETNEVNNNVVGACQRVP